MSEISMIWVFFFVIALAVTAILAVRSQQSNSNSNQEVAPLAVVDLASVEIYQEPLEGMKKAFLIGINYTGTAYELQGCQEDVQNMKEVLESKGFEVETCTDADDIKPTLDVIQAKIASFLLSLAPGETGVLWYSGHGLLLQDGENAWVPLDFLQSGFLDESWIISYLQSIPSTVRLFVGVDACHSGTTFNLKFDLEPEASRLMQTSSYKTVTKTKGVIRNVKESPFINAVQKDVDVNKQYELFDTTKDIAEMEASIIVLSASRDDQVSVEANENGEIQGAMTYAFLHSLESSNNIGQLQDNMRNILIHLPQTPQLSISRLFHPLSSLKAFGF
jgi:metacaspase-1